MNTTIKDYPVLVFFVTCSLLWLAERIGARAIRGPGVPLRTRGRMWA